MQKKTVWIAGWLFADLLLGLAMLFIISVVGLPPPTLAPPTPAPTWTPTWTPTGTSAPTTASPVRGTPGIVAPTPVPTPTPFIGLNPTPFVVTFRLDPNLVPDLLFGDARAKNVPRAQLRTQIRECFKKFDGISQAGIVLSFGGNPKPENGNKLAIEARNILQEEFPRVFTRMGTAYEDLHLISTDASVNGSIYMKVYFASRPDLPNAIDVGGGTCAPPPTWCQGSGSLQLNVFNWAGEVLDFVLDDKPYPVRYAGGENPAFRCILVNPGPRQWRANYRGFKAQGSIEIQAGKPEFLFFCVEDEFLVPKCKGAMPPPPLGGSGG